MQLTHHFLLAMPDLAGDYFANTVTYICEHNDEGAMGIIVNRPTRISVTELLGELHLPANRDLVDVPVLEGGPVSQEQGFVLCADATAPADAIDLPDGLYLSAAMETLRDLANNEGPARYLVALGYAGWGAGQLEQEMATNAWLSVPADPDILFTVPFASRLEAAAQIVGIDINLISRPGTA